MPVSGRNRQWVGRDSNSQPTPSRCGAETPQKVARRNWAAVQPAESADGIRSAQARGRCSSGGWPECAEGSLFLKPYPAEVHLTHSNIADSDGRRSNDLLIHCLLPAAPCVCQTWTPRPGWHLPDTDLRSDLPVRRTQEPNSLKSTPMAAIVTARRMRWQDAAPHEPRVQPGTPRQSPRHTSTNRRSSKRCSAR